MKAPNPLTKPLLSVPEVAEWLGIGRSNAYVQAREYIRSNGARGIPAVELSESRIVVPTGRLLAWLGIDPAAEQAPSRILRGPTHAVS